MKIHLRIKLEIKRKLACIFTSQEETQMSSSKPLIRGESGVSHVQGLLSKRKPGKGTLTHEFTEQALIHHSFTCLPTSCVHLLVQPWHLT